MERIGSGNTNAPKPVPSRAPELPRPSRVNDDVGRGRSRSPPPAPRKLRRSNATLFGDDENIQRHAVYDNEGPDAVMNPYIDHTGAAVKRPSTPPIPITSLTSLQTVVRRLNFDDMVDDGTPNQFDINPLAPIPDLPPLPGSVGFSELPLSTRMFLPCSIKNAAAHVIAMLRRAPFRIQLR